MARIAPLSGFPELLPEQRMVEQQVIDVLRHTFELHGFAGIETRAVEPLEQLLSKGETSKEVYLLRRLQDAEGEAGKDARLGLHFDLTVPLARYVVENAGKLQFPFRRYQIQRVWRGERPQNGRYREFAQADVDIVGSEELPFHHDVEVARVMVDALSRLDFLPPFRLQLNNRKLLEGYFRGLGVDPAVAMNAVDKLDKRSPDVVTGILLDAGIEAEVAKRCLAIAEISSEDTGFVDRVRSLGVQHQLLDEGLAELATVLEGCSRLAGGRISVEASLRIARGLDYYTGTVFETRMVGFDELGSICSGGRYDSLASDGRSTYPGVGISLGLSRVLVPLLTDGHLNGSRAVPSAVLVALVDDESRDVSDQLAAALRDNQIPCEVAAAAQKYGRQIRYAERRGIPYVLFPGADGEQPQVKDIRSGDQWSVDPATWSPPIEDLRVRVVTKEQHP